MINVSTVPDVFRPWRRITDRQPFSEGLAVIDYLPDAALKRVVEHPDDHGLRLLVNGLEAGPLTTLSNGDELWVVHQPRGAALPFIINALISVAVSFVLSKLFPPPKLGGVERGDESSPTYAFSGISNSRAEGQPIAVVYGEMRVGGQVIGEYAEVSSLFPPQTDLHMLLAFGEGPIHSILGQTEDTAASAPLGSSSEPLPVGAKINDNVAGNYRGVEIHTRRGTQEQEVIPSFEATRQAYTVDQTLRAPESSDEATNVYVIQRGGGAEFDNTNDDHWDEYGVAFDLNVDDVDEFVVRVNFPNGIFRQDQTTGNLVSAWFGMQIRYRELDSGGTPIASGGPNGDGWVRLPIIDNAPYAQRGSFNLEYRIPFLDKNNYTDPVIGQMIYSAGTAGRIGMQQESFPVGANGSLGAFSLATWVRFNQTSFDAPAIGTWFHILGDYSDATKRGFSIGLEYVERTFLSVTQTGWVWAVEWGNGTQRFTRDASNPLSLTNSPGYGFWYHVGFTYERQHNHPGGETQFRLYVNNQRILDFEMSDGSRMTSPGSGDNHLRIWQNPQGTATGRFEEFVLDDLSFWSIAVSAAVISQSYNGGVGTSAAIRPDVRVGHWDWNGATAGLVNQASPNQGGKWWGDAVVENGTPSVGTAPGRVATNSSGAYRKGQYRVEVIRANRYSTASNVQNDSVFAVISSILDSELAYPNVALAGVKIPATEQLSGSSPTVSMIVRGRLVPVWDGISEINPGITPTWSQNPAWIALDILTNTRYGLGQFYSVADIVLPDLLAWALYCESTVYDGGLQQTLTADGFDNVFYYGDTLDPDTGEERGHLELWINPTNLPGDGDLPTEWVIGKRMYLTGFPEATHSSGNFHVEINSDTATPEAFQGYEVFEVTRATSGAQQHIIKVWWDRLGEGHAFGAPAWPASIQTELVPDDLGDFEATVSGGHARFAFNGVFDVSKTAWDALLNVCTVGRAIPVREGGRVRFKFNRPREISGIVGFGSIVEGSFEVNYTGPSQKPNVYELTILDALRDFESTTLEAKSDDVNPTTNTGLRRTTQTLFGVTDAQQAVRAGRFQVLANELLLREGKFTLGANGLEYEPGDLVQLAHDILPRGTSGRIWATNSGGDLDTFQVDRELLIESGKSYTFRLHDDEDVVQEIAVDTVATSPGTYPPGSTIHLVSDLRREPRQDEVWVVAEDGTELVVEVTNVKLNPDLSKDVEFVEYNEGVYDDNPTTPLSEQLTFAPSDGLGSGGSAEIIPQPVDQLTLSDRFVRTGGGQFLLTLSASWQVPIADRPFVSGYELFIRERDESLEGFPELGVAEVGEGATADLAHRSTPWRSFGRAVGYDTRFDGPIPSGLAGREIDVAVVAVSERGARLLPEEANWQTHVVLGFGPHPPAPTDLVGRLTAQKAVYLWSLAAGYDDSAVELRRTSYADPVVAGWILAPRVYQGAQGERGTPAIRDWAGSALGTTTLLARAVNALGHKSDLATADFEPSPDLDSFDPSIEDAVVSWSTYANSGNDWVTAVPATGDPTVIDLAQVGDAGEKYLELDGSALEGQWTGASDEAESYGVGQDRRPREYFVEAVLVAEQIHPQTLSGSQELGSPESARMTLEGPTHLHPSESECVVRIQARFNVDGTSGGWSSYQDFRPGLYTFVTVQFRMLVTRPNDTYNVKIHKLETRISAPRLGIGDAPPLDRALASSFF